MFDMETINNKTLLTREEAAFYIGVCRNTMQKYMHMEDFPELIKVGRQKLYINRVELEKWNENRKK